MPLPAALAGALLVASTGSHAYVAQEPSPTTSAESGPSPSVSLDPSSGPVGQTVMVNGSGFLSCKIGNPDNPASGLGVFDPNGTQLQSVGIDGITRDGSFSTTFQAPDDPPGTVTIEVRCLTTGPGSSNVSAQADFTVVVPPPPSTDVTTDTTSPSEPPTSSTSSSPSASATDTSTGSPTPAVTPASGNGSGGGVTAIIIVIALLALVAWAVRRSLQHGRRGRLWVARHLHTALRAGPSSAAAEEHPHAAGPTRTVRLVPRPDPAGTQSTEETQA